jgi:hypothetical protein
LIPTRTGIEVSSRNLLNQHLRTAPPAANGVRPGLLGRWSLGRPVPQVAELDLNPVIARPDGSHVVDARILLRPAQPSDPYLRQLE